MLLTKLHIPTPTKSLVHRTKLFPLLNEGFRRKLILISAPAGYGKTMLLSDWIFQQKINAAWYSINQRDNNPEDFLGFVLQSIQTVNPEIGLEAQALIDSSERIHIDYILEALLADFAGLEEEILLVLDDFHLIENKVIIDLINYLLEILPKNLHLAISTRFDPPLPMARMRTHEELVEIRSSELSFSQAEVFSFFNKKLRVKLSQSDLLNLQQKTEGWIAGLQLTSLAVEGRNDLSEYLEKLAGDNRYIMDYLLEEVLHRQTSEVQDFLLKTSLLEQFCSELCNAVLGHANSQQLIEELERSNMFLVPLDDERKWYRYHHLFGDLLQLHLRSGSSSTRAEIHQRASDWFDKNEMMEPAVEHAFDAGDPQRAMNILNRHIAQIWENGRTGLAIRFGRLFSESLLLGNPEFCLLFGWGLVITGQLQEARTILNQLLRQLQSPNGNTSSPGLITRVHISLTLLYTFLGNTSEAYKYSGLALQKLQEVDPVWASWAYICHGEICVAKLDVINSHRYFSLALESANQLKIPFLSIIAVIEVSYTLLLQARYEEARQHCLNKLEEIARWSSVEQRQVEIYTSMFHSMLGLIYAHRNQPEESMQHATRGYELSRQTDNSSFVGYCAWLYTNSLVYLGKYPEAMSIVSDMKSDNRLNQLLWAMAYSLQLKLLVLQENTDEAQHFLDAANQSISVINEYEEYLLAVAKARLWLQQYRVQEALELLESYEQKTFEGQIFELYLEIVLLKAKGLAFLNRKEDAKACLMKALQLSNTEKLIRCYTNLGPEMESIIREARDQQETSSDLHQHLSLVADALETTKVHQQASNAEILSRRELDTLKLIAQNLTNQEIANKLYISLNTVKTHLKNINQKLEVDNRNKAVAKAREIGLI